MYDQGSQQKRTSPVSVALVLIGVALVAAVGYDAYVRAHPPQQEAQTVAATQVAAANTQLQTQLQNALDRVSQSDKQTSDVEQERMMWQTLARAAVQGVAARPPSLQTVQRAVFGSSDAQTRQFLRDYFKNPANLEKVASLVLLTSSMMQPGPAMRTFVRACNPLFMEPLPEMSPTNADAKWCYEFLKRRQAEGGDVAAWQKLLAAVAAEIDKKT